MISNSRKKKRGGGSNGPRSLNVRLPIALIILMCNGQPDVLQWSAGCPAPQLDCYITTLKANMMLGESSEIIAIVCC